MHPLKDRGFRHPVASDITPRDLWQNRRQWMQAAAAAGMGLAGLSSLNAQAQALTGPGKLPKLAAGRSGVAGAIVMDKPTSYADLTHYNNFYEFGTDKGDPGRLADSLQTRPWTVTIEGAVQKPRTFGIEDLLKLAPLEERIYRLRCVEGWSMVIPWIGYSLSQLIKQVQPTGNAKYVEFVSQANPAQMPGLRSGVLDWPYREGLRMDEAMHPLTLLAMGLYGEVLPKQNGAPVRLVVPWKYGFKSAKSLVKIRLVEQQPVSSWTRAAPEEYGFFSNVNPHVDHPRWSQATERRIGEDGLFTRKRPTLMFNGYEAQVGSLYAGMDLKKYY
ncbi:protein-methionine-sulfoxide reductase catalytic subunit MsrP [Ideonella dechloratans]|uniref:Protein-methionine-sulfoxide reductase catalytic subunit MsrP n=1 Tax=Ideonella dechloratans TaxID=36863 RepID=A0A643FCQ5_IDEDE|nr:protein-methionine-sulfoxide reductase catalytic subunit MsrP [Ideonella dechloratans]KAB0580593.1 protein-methionine-sulfoxide reductase catalytic subunit MsrP [Ideonella dechloratans]UFU09459.1 protein-methionine-sulfoxide reductase catalytic subunit MsrP [Ideonella dechloratans]